MSPLSGPLKVSVDVTDRCNLSCVHCRLRGAPLRPESLTSDLIEGLIRSCVEMRVFRLALSGGEPLLRDDIADIADRALCSGIPRLFISTNGTLITPQLVARLARHRSRITFKVSIDGVASVHDSCRSSAGAFDGAVAGIRLVQDAGFAVYVTTAVTRLTLDVLPETLALVRRAGAQRHYVVEVIPPRDAMAGLALTTHDRRAVVAMLRYAEDAADSRATRIVSKIPFADGAAPGFECCAGISECAVLSDGTIVGCRLLPHIAEGDLRAVSLSTAWRRQGGFAFFRRPQDALEMPCRACQFGPTCRGGCRAYAAGNRGEPLSPDPRCPRGREAHMRPHRRSSA